MSTSQFPTLFSILGTTYGGDGQNTFALPDLRGRMPIGQGPQGSGTSARQLGESGGSESVTLLTSQMPAHTHAVLASTQPGTHATPTPTSILASSSQRDAMYIDAAAAGTTVDLSRNIAAGGGQPHENMPPFLSLSFIIALEGFYPSQN